MMLHICVDASFYLFYRKSLDSTVCSIKRYILFLVKMQKNRIVEDSYKSLWTAIGSTHLSLGSVPFDVISAWEFFAVSEMSLT